MSLLATIGVLTENSKGGGLSKSRSSQWSKEMVFAYQCEIMTFAMSYTEDWRGKKDTIMTLLSFHHASDIMKHDNHMKHMNHKQSMCSKLN